MGKLLCVSTVLTGNKHVVSGGAAAAQCAEQESLVYH